MTTQMDLPDRPTKLVVGLALVPLLVHLAVAVHGLAGANGNERALGELRGGTFVEQFALLAGLAAWWALIALGVLALGLGRRRHWFALIAAVLAFGAVAVSQVAGPLQWHSLTGPTIQWRTDSSWDVEGYRQCVALDVFALAMVGIVLVTGRRLGSRDSESRRPVTARR